jgi:pimeloyl-ACP methyl ester carboxylesterase
MDQTGTQDLHLTAPLAHLAGARPDAPAWFERALARAPERSVVPVAGARIKTLTWGERGRPGLLFLHGNSAHADWWSFIAPFFADRFRIAALSWSGMGGSDWREGYSLDLFVAEAMTVAEATGLLESDVKPVIVAHSFGGFVTLAAAARHGERLKGAVLVDTPIFLRERRSEQSRTKGPDSFRPNRIYPTLEAALARFRYAPLQPCGNLFITDYLARHSLRKVETGEGGGWTWKFDPCLWRGYESESPASSLSATRCPLALINGECSPLISDDDLARTQILAGTDVPVIAIPEAYHHVLADQPLALVAAIRSLLAVWP